MFFAVETGQIEDLVLSAGKDRNRPRLCKSSAPRADRGIFFYRSQLLREDGHFARPEERTRRCGLMGPERWSSHEEHQECLEGADMGHAVFAVTGWPFALVQRPFQFSYQGLQDRHGAIESKILPRRPGKSAVNSGQGRKFCALS